METIKIIPNPDFTEEEAQTFIKDGLKKKHKIFFDTWMKEHVEQVITERLTAFLKGHPKIDALCSVQSLTIGDCKE